MISEELQDQASLYALDLLNAEEAAAFERELSANPELQTLVRELRDAAASVALGVAQQSAPPAVKDRVLAQIGQPGRKIIAFPSWIPWAIAAALAVFCGILAVDRVKLKGQLAAEINTTPVLVSLAPMDPAPAKAEATVMWLPEKQNGVIKLRNLPPAARGKDYQLWAVDGAHKDPIDAGILHPTSEGAVEIHFQPKAETRQVQAFAISLERKGGVPKAQGPMLFVGKI